MQSTTFWRFSLPVRLEGEELTALRDKVMRREKWRCVECGRRVSDDVPDWLPRKAHMAHKTGRGRGGDDSLENCECRCGECHFRFEHAPKAIPRKRKL